MEISRKQFLTELQDIGPNPDGDDVQKISATKLVMQSESVIHDKHLTFSLQVIETDVEGFTVPHLIKSVAANPAIPVQMAQVLATFHETIGSSSHQILTQFFKDIRQLDTTSLLSSAPIYLRKYENETSFETKTGGMVFSVRVWYDVADHKYLYLYTKNAKNPDGIFHIHKE